MKQVTPVGASDIIRAKIRDYKDKSMLSFRKIAAKPEFKNMTPGTICDIYHGGMIPRRYWPDFGIVELAPAPVCPIHHIVHVTKRCPSGKPAAPRVPRICKNCADLDKQSPARIDHFEGVIYRPCNNPKTVKMIGFTYVPSDFGCINWKGIPDVSKS